MTTDNPETAHPIRIDPDVTLAIAQRPSPLRRIARVLVLPLRSRPLAVVRRRWRLLAFVAALVAAVVVFVVPRVTEGDGTAEALPPAPVAVTQQDLFVTVPAVGTLDYGSTVELEFGQTGVLADVMVTVGDSVAKGDTLAVLEATELQRAVDDAASALTRAQLDLAELRADPDFAAMSLAELDLAGTRAVLADLLAGPDAAALSLTELDLAEARAALADLQAPPDDASVAGANSAAASARAQVVSAQDSLDRLLAGATDSEIADSRSSLSSAQASLISAQGSLTDLQAAPTALAMEAADDKVAAAAEATAAAKRDLAAAVDDHPTIVADAESRLAIAQAELVAASTALADLRSKPTPEAIRDAEITLEQARLTHDDTVRTGSNASAEQKERAAVVYEQAQREFITEISPATAAEISEAESRLASVQANIVVTQAALDGLAGGPDLTALNDAVAAAERHASTAVLERDELLAGPRDTDLATRRSSVNSASISVSAARARLANLTDDPGPEDVLVAEESLASARASLTDAEARLADVLAGAEASALRQAQVAVTRAEIAIDELRSVDASALRQAEAAVTRADIAIVELRSAADPIAVERQELAIADATRQVEAAREALAESILVAPIAGVVLSVNGDVGERVSGAVISLGAADDLRVRVNIDETDIGLISVGQAVDMTFQALGDRAYGGSVSRIAAQGVVDQGLVTFSIDIALDAPAEGLRAGLTSDVSILVGEARDAIVVPKAAVQSTRQGGIAFVVGSDGAIERRGVQTGLSNAFLIQIVSGLRVGERVMPNAAQALADARAAAQAEGGTDGIPAGRSAGPGGGQGFGPPEGFQRPAGTGQGFRPTEGFQPPAGAGEGGGARGPGGGPGGGQFGGQRGPGGGQSGFGGQTGGGDQP